MLGVAGADRSALGLARRPPLTPRQQIGHAAMIT
jgi:hypothetical protein